MFPCFFGAALRLDGLDRLLQGLQTLTRMPPVWPEFGARVFKISQDDAGTRLSWLKVTGGELPVKAVLPNGEKADALRLYNGSKFRLVSTAYPGMVVAVAGPAATRPGQGLGAEADADAPLLEPVLNYRADCPDADPHTLLKALQTLEDEDPQLHVAWRDDLAEVHVQLMGEVQLEILQTLLASRFGLQVTFSEGGILYKETITAAVEGIGHYEPLRHYAEVHLLLEPGARGSGVQLAADCPPDTLAENWATAGADPSGGAHPPRRAHRGAAHRCEDHAGGGQGPPETHRGGRFPAGHLPRRAAGASDSPEQERCGAAGALV